MLGAGGGMSTVSVKAAEAPDAAVLVASAPAAALAAVWLIRASSAASRASSACCAARALAGHLLHRLEILAAHQVELADRLVHPGANHALRLLAQPGQR